MKHLFIKVVSVEPLEGYRLLLTFEDGSKKIYDMSNELSGYYFEPLKDIEFFKKVTIQSGGLEWPNGAGICHDKLYRHGIDMAEKIA